MDNGTLCAKDNLREGQRPTINLTAHLKLIERTPVAKPQNEFQQCNMRNKMLKKFGFP